MRTGILLVSIMLTLVGCGGGGGANNAVSAGPAAPASASNAVAAEGPGDNAMAAAPAPQNAPPVDFNMSAPLPAEQAGENALGPVPDRRAEVRRGPRPSLPVIARAPPFEKGSAVPRILPIEAGPPDANHGQAAPPALALNQAAPEPIPAADGTVFCALMNERMSVADCAYFREVRSRLEAGRGALQAPRQMVRNQASRVSFALARPASPERPGAVTDPAELLPGRSEATPTVPLGRRMAVQLSGDGFSVTPEGPVERDLSIAGAARWDWQVTPREPGQRELQLTAYVVVRAPGQTSGTPSLLLSFAHQVEVTVDRKERTKEVIERWTGWFNLTNSGVVALTVLLGSIGALLLALKKPRAWLKRQWRRLRGQPAGAEAGTAAKPRKPRAPRRRPAGPKGGR